MLKLNPDAIGIRDEQLRGFAALRYLGTRGAQLNESPQRIFGIEIRNRHAVREIAGFRPAACRRQRKEMRTAAEIKYNRVALPNRRAKQFFVEGRGPVHIRY